MTMTDHTTPRLISLEHARDCIQALDPLGTVTRSLAEGLGRITAADLFAQSDCPSVDASLKDGYAVLARDIRDASPERPVSLGLRGTRTAGQEGDLQQVAPGSAIRIMSGAALPTDADAVLSSEFAVEKDGMVLARRDAHPGRNILPRGADVRAGSLLVRAGTRLTPTHLGLLAAGGISALPVYRHPRVAVIATGSELVPPGQAIAPGKVAASNMVTLEAELRSRGLPAATVILHDDLDHLERQLRPLLEANDVVLTCGGVLDGDKDFTMRAMDRLGVEPVFRRVRIGPGKGICMGRWGHALIFNLPGGPPSNHVAFLLLALPGILRLSGVFDPMSPRDHALITAPLIGQVGWTQLIYARRQGTSPRTATPIHNLSRLQAMAEADCLIELPEEVADIGEGDTGILWNIR